MTEEQGVPREGGGGPRRTERVAELPMTSVRRLACSHARVTVVEPPGDLGQPLVGERILGLLGDSPERGPGEVPRTRVEC